MFPQAELTDNVLGKVLNDMVMIWINKAGGGGTTNDNRKAAQRNSQQNEDLRYLLLPVYNCIIDIPF